MTFRPEREFTIYLSEVDRLHIRLRTFSKKGRSSELVDFCLVYEAYLDKKWRAVAKYDCNKGKKKKPHRHVMDWKGSQQKITLGDYGDASTIFNQAKSYILKNYEKLKGRFINTKQRYE